MKQKIGIVSLGCAKNLINTEQMMYLLDEAGYAVHSGDETGFLDAVVINTCAFIESAKTEAVDVILEYSELKAKGIVGKIIVAGCLPQRYKDEILIELPEIDAVVGTGSFDDIVEAVEIKLEQQKDCCSDAESSGLVPRRTRLRNSPSDADNSVLFKDISAPVSETGRIITTSPLWTYLKIAEGCDNNCAYCCIPSIRGAFRSRPIENIVKEAELLSGRGIKEFIIVAQDVTRYGFDLYGKYALTELLRELSGITGVMWIRLMYLYPDEINDELIDEIEKNDKIVKYLDIPIQHISDKILSNMNRRGSGSQIRELFKKLRERIHGLVLRTSIITGLPGEGEAEFEELLDFLREAKIERTGVFTYSPEEGTPAAKMQYPDEKTAQYRAEIIRKLQSQIMDDFDKSRSGMEMTMIDGRSYAEAPEDLL